MFYAVNLRKATREVRVSVVKRTLPFVVAVCVLTAVYMTAGLLFPLRYLNEIERNCALYDIPPAFICALIHAESKFRHDARSAKGASGLMQITNMTADWMAEEMKLENYSYDRIFEPEVNIRIGIYYFATLLKDYDNNYETALAAYNAGSGNVSKWLKNADYSKNGKTLSYIPFRETRDYLKRVSVNYKIYQFIIPLYREPFISKEK